MYGTLVELACRQEMVVPSSFIWSSPAAGGECRSPCVLPTQAHVTRLRAATGCCSATSSERLAARGGDRAGRR